MAPCNTHSMPLLMHCKANQFWCLEAPTAGSPGPVWLPGLQLAPRSGLWQQRRGWQQSLPFSCLNFGFHNSAHSPQTYMSSVPGCVQLCPTLLPPLCLARPASNICNTHWAWDSLGGPVHGPPGTSFGLNLTVEPQLRGWTMQGNSPQHETFFVTFASGLSVACCASLPTRVHAPSSCPQLARLSARPNRPTRP